MEENLRAVHEHMRGLGLGALKHAIMHAHLDTPDNDFWAELSIIQAAHAAEILIKARIAEEHPLLIFEQLPRLELVQGQRLAFEHLVQEGRTIQFADLPNRLWAVSG